MVQQFLIIHSGQKRKHSAECFIQGLCKVISSKLNLQKKGAKYLTLLLARPYKADPYFLHLRRAVQKSELLLFLIAVTAHKHFFSITSGGNFIFGEAVGKDIFAYW